jgi:hypothetical protein
MRWVEKLANVGYWSQTGWIEICCVFSFAVVFFSMYFCRFLPEKQNLEAISTRYSVHEPGPFCLSMYFNISDSIGTPNHPACVSLQSARGVGQYIGAST